MKRLFQALIIVLLVVGVSATVSATTILYDVRDLGSGKFEYEYSVTNDTLAVDIEEFTIFFDMVLYSNLSLTLTPTGWDPLVIQPDIALPADGFYDALALVSRISPGDTLGGFGVSFDWLGTGTPWSQLFEVVDPTTFETLDSGATIPVPEPLSILLLASGLGGLAIVKGRRRILRL